jgi:hypothetical protein
MFILIPLRRQFPFAISGWAKVKDDVEKKESKRARRLFLWTARAQKKGA